MTSQKPFDLRLRTSLFAREILRLCCSLPPGNEVGTIKRQLFRAATSVGANYRAALRAESKRDFISRLGTVEEEADECIYWLDLLGETDATPNWAFRRLQCFGF